MATQTTSKDNVPASTEPVTQTTETAKTATAATPEPVAPGAVTLTAEAFSALMKRLSDLETTQNLVLQVQDKNKVAKIEEMRRAGKLVKSVKIRKYNGKYIVGWKTVQDEVYKDEMGRLVEKQTVELFYEDGTKFQMSMRQWAVAPEYVAFEVTKESKDAEGNLFFTCVGPDGKTIELNANFIN